MARIVKEYKRNSPQRKRKKLIVIGCEGETNKTEKSYFAGLERKINSCHFEFVEGKTDPLGIVKRIEAKAEELDKRDVNRYYAVFDVDNDINKKNKIEKARKHIKNSKYDIELITSNPSFEIWLLLHFTYTTKEYKNSKEVIRELKNYIHEYKKNNVNIEQLYPLLNDAIRNSEKLYKYHKRNNNDISEDYLNPYTKIFEIIKQI